MTPPARGNCVVVRGDVRPAKHDANLKDETMASRTAKKTAAPAKKTPAKRPAAKQATVPAKTPRKATAKPKATNEAKAPKNATKAKPEAKTETGKKLSQMAAAIQILTQAKQPMTAKAMVEAMVAKGLWSSPGGKTPEATLYASIIRDIRRGADARFQKVARGQFDLAGK